MTLTIPELLSAGALFASLAAWLFGIQGVAFKARDDVKAMEARIEKVEELVAAVNSLGERLSGSIDHLTERFSTEIKHLSERQADHNKVVTDQLTEIRTEQKSFRATMTTRRRTAEN